MATLARAPMGGIVTFPMTGPITPGLLETPDEAPVADGAETDDRLMAAFCAGDETAFSALYERHAATLFRFLRRLVGQRELAEDVLQTTFLSVVRARGRYQPGTRVRSWLYAIAANAARDALRRARVRLAEVGLPDAVANAADPMAPLDDGGDDPAVRAALSTALGSLPPDQREAVVLHHLEGLSFPEIAQILGVTAGAAKVRAHRGYERLRALLGSMKETP